MEKKAIRVAYGEAIVKLGAENDKVVVLDADLAAATMTNGFKKAYPDRFIDCGIAEANMVDMAAGMPTRASRWARTAAPIRRLRISP